nr:PREDICTED: C-C motif chemokine 28-like isoform X1 [Latimeria chalumnae]|eukprot:XP_006013836.1 PREDICTED: C-C motif chemokine 28-like isoform X1 [Latimeria chalumnae]
MDLKASFLLVASVLILIQISDGMIKNVNVNCCTEVASVFPAKLLRKVKSFKLQKADGVCDICAVVLHYKDRQFCVDPKNKHLKAWMRQNHQKQQTKMKIK